MFGLLNRRMLREQIKLIHQNMSTAEGYLAGSFHDNPEILVLLSAISFRTREIAKGVEPRQRVHREQLKNLITMNLDLRRLYDGSAGRVLESFDQATAPMMGWDWTISRELSDD